MHGQYNNSWTLSHINNNSYQPYKQDETRQFWRTFSSSSVASSTYSSSSSSSYSSYEETYFNTHCTCSFKMRSKHKGLLDFYFFQALIKLNLYFRKYCFKVQWSGIERCYQHHLATGNGETQHEQNSTSGSLI